MQYLILTIYHHYSLQMVKPHQRSIAAGKCSPRRSRQWRKHNLRRQSFSRWRHVASESDSWQKCCLRLSQRRGTSQRQLRGERKAKRIFSMLQEMDVQLRASKLCTASSPCQKFTKPHKINHKSIFCRVFNIKIICRSIDCCEIRLILIRDFFTEVTIINLHNNLSN